MLLPWGFWLAQGVFPLKVIGDLRVLSTGVGVALAHLDLADKIAGNFARRTAHAFDYLRQLAVIGLLKAAARFDGTGGRSFRPYARTYANGEITHYLRDHGFAIKVPPT